MKLLKTLGTSIIACCLILKISFAVEEASATSLRQNVQNMLKSKSGANDGQWLECMPQGWNEDTFSVEPCPDGYIGTRPGGIKVPPMCTKKCVAKFDVPQSEFDTLPGGAKCAGNPKVTAKFNGAVMMIEGDSLCVPCGENPSPSDVDANTDAQICGLGQEVLNTMNPENWADWGAFGKEIEYFFTKTMVNYLDFDGWTKAVSSGFKDIEKGWNQVESGISGINFDVGSWF